MKIKVDEDKLLIEIGLNKVELDSIDELIDFIKGDVEENKFNFEKLENKIKIYTKDLVSIGRIYDILMILSIDEEYLSKFGIDPDRDFFQNYKPRMNSKTFNEGEIENSVVELIKNKCSSVNLYEGDEVVSFLYPISYMQDLIEKNKSRNLENDSLKLSEEEIKVFEKFVEKNQDFELVEFNF